MREYRKNEREVTSEEQKIELAKLQLAKLEKKSNFKRVKNKALSLNPAAKVEEKQFETNIENMIKILCKKANGAMKTSSVEFISRSPNPLPMKSGHHRFVLLQRIFQPWQWKREGKKRNRFEQTSRTLQRKI
ncbi:hypothetical protein TNCV_1254241 [Trichonephila clavipes]|nr:hypothetical protein TNCV_1254241 [Trichonephila clavipes]